MPFTSRIFPSEADAHRPRLACEITSAGVVAARPGTSARSFPPSSAPRRALADSRRRTLPIARPSPALRQALDEVNSATGRSPLSSPMRRAILLLDFDTVSSKASKRSDPLSLA